MNRGYVLIGLTVMGIVAGLVAISAVNHHEPVQGRHVDLTITVAPNGAVVGLIPSGNGTGASFDSDVVVTGNEVEGRLQYHDSDGSCRCRHFGKQWACRGGDEPMAQVCSMADEPK